MNYITSLQTIILKGNVFLLKCFSLSYCKEHAYYCLVALGDKGMEEVAMAVKTQDKLNTLIIITDYFRVKQMSSFFFYF